MSETRDNVSIRIDHMLLGLPSSPWRPSIFRVHDDIHSGMEKFYNPKVVSIGPFHHGKDNLQKMEQHKLRYLQLLLKRRKESSVDKYIVAMRTVEEKVRRCYGDPVEFSSNVFVEMLLLDGCFIVELIRKNGFDEMSERDDPIFQFEQVLSQLRHDLMLVENQVPFFVIDQLFSMTGTGNPDDDILHLIQLFLGGHSPWPEAAASVKVSGNNVDHLLGLMHMTWCSSFAKIMPSNKPVHINEETTVPMYSTTELNEAGVKLEKDIGSKSWLGIKFSKGIMKIPGFNVSDETESILRNLIAYEHFFIDNHPKYVTDYAYFLHGLIKSSKDVEALRLQGILSNLPGNDDMVHHMFNRMGRNILVTCNFCYSDVYDKVHAHCRRSKHRWMANLRRSYLNSPWAYISLSGAVWLLVLTLAQTVFSILSYVKSK